MASSRRTNHSRQRHQRHASISSDGSSASIQSDGDGDGVGHSHQRPLTTPRTKRRSITQLSELVRRQKEEQQQQRRHYHTVTPQEIERKMESLLAPRASPGKPRERRLIQVAVRCRPRKCRRFRKRRAFDSASDDDNDEEDEEDDGFSDGDNTGNSSRERLPSDSVVEYDFPKVADSSPSTMAASRNRSLPAISVPSHVLALGGHGPRRRFEFDCVFPPWKQQRDVYDATAYEVIEEVLATATAGQSASDDITPTAAHATVVAYGQTGTGKTYTMGMLQHADVSTDEREHGIIPRALIHILSRIHDANESHEKRDGTRLVASISFLQIYLETIQDLLVLPGRATTNNQQASGERRRSSMSGGQQTTNGGLQVRLDPATNEFYVAGLSEFSIRDVSDARVLLERAAQNRVLAATARNKTSSRSHTLLTISIKRKRLLGASDSDEEIDDDSMALSTVSFVDLAGSERVEGALHFLHATRKRQELRIREAKFINRSLSALGSVIAALSAQEDRRNKPTGPCFSRKNAKLGSPRSPLKTTLGVAPHIRFRDSQLTKLLQSRLMNGQGRLVLIATIDDRPANLTETLSTLKFASQCRRVDLSKSRAAKADAARKEREETLLKQVFAEVKTMYEAREAELLKQYESRIEALNQQLHSIQRESHPTAINAPRPNAAYVALCSLVDIAQRQHGRPNVQHPSLDAFEDENGMVKYVADLYRQLKDVISQNTEANPASELTRVESSETRRRSSTRYRRNQSRVVDRDPEVPVSAVAEVEHIETPPPTQEVRVASVTATSANIEADFQALARFMFTSGLLQSIPVSSDEEGEEPYNQLQ